MSWPEQLNRFVDLLRRVVDGSLLPDAALREAEAWTDVPWKDRKLKEAWHTLMHFQIDEDLREKDPEYDKGLRNQLPLHIAKLRSAASAAKDIP
jgi:hypothetical protein